MKVSYLLAILALVCVAESVVFCVYFLIFRLIRLRLLFTMKSSVLVAEASFKMISLNSVSMMI